MSVWLLLVLLAAVKIPLAGLLFWLTLSSDEAMTMRDGPAVQDSSDGGGGSKVPPSHGPRPRRPFPVRPRRGPHGLPPASPSTRMRHSDGRRGTVRAPSR